MSDFLVNLVRRGAGLPAASVHAPQALPFGPEIHKHADGSTEELITGNTESVSPLSTCSSEHMELSFEAPTHLTPSIQRFSGTESMVPSHPAIGKPTATVSAPPLGPPPASRGQVTSDEREAEAAVQPPQDSDLAVPPFRAHHEVMTGAGGDGGLHATSPVADTIELRGEPTGHVGNTAPDLLIMIREPGETPLGSTAERSADGPWDRARKTREPALSAPTIRPAMAELHTLLQFPKDTSVPSPTPASQPPIHVRIGRVEVRAAPVPTPAPARPSQPAPLGFDSYYRVRTYRS